MSEEHPSIRISCPNCDTDILLLGSDAPCREQDIRYLYENALSQIACLTHHRRPEDAERLVEWAKKISESALRHDFHAIYPGHTEEFHKAIEKRAK